ncbi:MAG TPA: sulfatase-like hydrolase/transferase [Chloroflexota bacterium]|nr:sulfatase-like hydrolase/transferase [Chloroflexota bacterium]
MPAGTTPRAAGRRKNVLVLMADEQRWDSLGHNGNAAARTPHLDALAARGASFERCYTPYPLCCPARASLWTGLLPHQHHVTGNWLHLRPDLQDGARHGLVRAFAAHGYHTLYTGKWHVPGTTPARLGFADSAAIPAVLNGRDRGRYIEPYRAYAESLGYRLVPNHIENLTERDVAQLKRPGKAPCGTAEIALEHFLETWQTTQFLDRLDARPAGQPFFAVCSYNAPHFPMIVPAPYDTLVDPATVTLPPSLRTGTTGKPREVSESHYAHLEHELDESEWRRLIAHYLGLCALVDAQVGRIVDYLDGKGLLDDTIVVYTADHGDMLGAHALFEKGYPLHYEEALRVPLLVVDPDQPAPARPRALTSLMDVVPTVAQLAGVPLPADPERQGCAAAVTDDPGPPARAHVIAETFAYGGKESGAGSHLDFAHFASQGGSANLSIRTDSARYVFRWNDEDELFDLAADPHEVTNLASERHTLLESLRSTLLQELRRTDPRFAAAVEQRVLAKAA